ncbi:MULTISPECIES: hypothetical protein [Sphingobacterium]|uniref:hypothetical protein n=1 Tax=Sphingobacterium TaxID=28453 RepID=UPI00257E078D|nr:MULTISPECIES: hypothetical protein [Sphingobacterium]
MKKGIDLIKEKREGHFYSDHRPIDDLQYGDGSLLKVAITLLTGDANLWPSSWPEEVLNKLVNMGEVERLSEAAAFIAAEIDRLNFDQNVNYYCGIDMDVSYSGIVDIIQGDVSIAKEKMLELISVYFSTVKEKEMVDKELRGVKFSFTHVKQGLFHICNYMDFNLPLVINSGDECYEIDSDYNIEKKLNVL